MSKNHPNDNMYSILGKLEALKPTPEEKRFALVKEIRESVEAKGSVLQGVDAVQARLAEQFAKEGVVDSLRAKNYDRLSKRSYDQADKTKPGGVSVYNVDKINKGDDRAAKAAELRGEKVNGMAEAYNPVKAVKQCAKDYMEMNGYTSVDQLEAEDIESIGGDCQMNYQDVCEILGCKLPDSLGPVKSYDEHGDMEECAGCAMGECAEHGMYEGEISHPDKGVTRHTKTDYPGYPTDDADDIDDENKGKRGRPRKHAKKVATGLGRGRPVKAKAPVYSKMSDPFGRTTGAVPKSKTKGQVHSMAEAMTQLDSRFTRISEGLNFKRMAEETHQSIDELMSELQQDINNYKTSGHCSEKLKDFLTVHSHSKKQMADEATMAAKALPPAVNPHPVGSDAMAGKQDLAPRKPGMFAAIKDIAQGVNNFVKSRPETGPTHEEADPLEEELRQLAELAGIRTEGNSFSDKLAHTSKGDSFVQDGKTYTNNSSIADEVVDEEETDEGNLYGNNVRDAKADGKKQADLDNDGDLDPVKEDKLEVSEPNTKPVNNPKPEYKTMKQSTLNPGEDDNGEKAMHGDKPTFKNGDNPLTKPSVKEAVNTLEARLAAEYESIKKVG